MIARILLALALIAPALSARADDGPPPRDDFETDADGDGFMYGVDAEGAYAVSDDALSTRPRSTASECPLSLHASRR